MRFAVGTSERGFTLAEIVIASAVGMIMIGAAIYGYILAAKRAEWSGYSFAANSLAVQAMEQARSSRWDPLAYPEIDDFKGSNFPPQIAILDLPISGTNVVYATNFITITTMQENPPLRMIRVDCCWSFIRKGVFTNTIITYRAPDQ